jgi:(S)-2-hydroxyglutarate dehydrogenase
VVARHKRWENTVTSVRQARRKRFDIEWSGDVAVVGAGIVGLAVARELLRRRPQTRLAVVEKEPEIAQHQTGHNSGVIHSGIYYKPGSFKAKACVAGSAKMMQFCEERDIPYRRCGKVIIATEPEELPRLYDLYERGQANGCPDLRIIELDEIRELEPHAAGIKALLSPNTGIVDYRKVAVAYADDVRKSSAQIFTNHEVIGIRRQSGTTILETTSGAVEAKSVITCGGLWADRVAQMTGAPADPRIVPFRGDYYVLRHDRRHLVRSNIYPVPDPRFPFLGVHLTPRMDGEIWLGPNAVLAFARDGYRFRDVRLGDLKEMATFGGFLGFARKHWRTGAEEMLRDLSKKRFLESLQRYVPELRMDDLVPGPSGVRAQAMSNDGQLVDDFVFSESEGTLHVRNAPSPAATSSLVIAEMVVDRFEKMIA